MSGPGDRSWPAEIGHGTDRAGAGLTIACAVNAATAVSEPADAGAASALVNTSQMIGASVGTALLNSLAVTAAAAYLAAHTGQRQAASYAATTSYDTVFLVSAIVLLGGSVLIAAISRGDRPGATVTAAASAAGPRHNERKTADDV